MPNFLIIGAPKAGTSAIYYYLNQHPEIYMSPVKEPHFFALEGQSIDFQGPGDKERYRDAVTRVEDYRKLFDGVSDEIAIGEASTTYLSSPQAPFRIQHHIPDAKLIALLRNPADAAYACFLHLVRDGDEPLTDFARALQAEPQRIQQNWEGIWHYKNRSFYSPQIQRYLQVFDRNQLKIYPYDRFKQNPTGILQDIFQFLEVDDKFIPDMSERYNVSGMPQNSTLNKLMVKPNPIKSTINQMLPKEIRRGISNRLKQWNFRGYKKPPMPPEIRQQLLREYREDILKLQELIHHDLSHWLEPIESK